MRTWATNRAAADHAAHADIGEAALGRRLGRNLVTTLVRAIDFMLPSVMHVGGTRFLQV